MNDTGNRCRMPGYNFCQFAPGCMALDMFFPLDTSASTPGAFFSHDMHVTRAAQAMDPQYWTQPPFLLVQESRWA